MWRIFQFEILLLHAEAEIFTIGEPQQRLAPHHHRNLDRQQTSSTAVLANTGLVFLSHGLQQYLLVWATAVDL